MDCGNNPCDFAVDLRGQRTQGRCGCWDSLPKMDPEQRVALRRSVAEFRARIAALEAQLAQYRWRRVEEEMPEERGKMLVRFPRREEIWTRIAFYHGDGVWWSGGYSVKPTHWMPLPPAPEEGV